MTRGNVVVQERARRGNGSMQLWANWAPSCDARCHPRSGYRRERGQPGAEACYGCAVACGEALAGEGLTACAW